jgi:hypothetical protein
LGATVGHEQLVGDRQAVFDDEQATVGNERALVADERLPVQAIPEKKGAQKRDKGSRGNKDLKVFAVAADVSRLQFQCHC